MSFRKIEYLLDINFLTRKLVKESILINPSPLLSVKTLHLVSLDRFRRKPRV